jgi:ribonuclease HII
MPWVVGIDEAGYGPNLGPFVMSMAVLTVPSDHVETDHWRLFRQVVRRACDPDDGRLAVDDSKAVYTPARGLAGLEKNLCPFLWDQRWALALRQESIPVETLWRNCCLTPLDDLRAEPWYQPMGKLPASGICTRTLQARRVDLRLAFVDAGAGVLDLRSVILFPAQINALIAEHDTKAAMTAYALRRLLAHLPHLGRHDDPSTVLIDKLGGRNRYHELLQSSFARAPVMICCESARRSCYQVSLPKGTWEVRFEPRADARHFAVALASMMSKYLRELLMVQLNRFWQGHLPGLKPTAGYPADAARFYRDIQPARERLGIPDEVLWRVR